MTGRRHSVIVVGAGFCGLAAATELAAARVDVLVLEARNRVGGRVETVRNSLGEPVDTGGQFFCEDMPEITALARRFGKAFVETPMEGRFIVQPPVSEKEVVRSYDGATAIRDRMDALDPDDPAIAGLTVGAWLDRQADAPLAKAAFQSMVEGLSCRPAASIPLWYLVGYERRLTNEISELQYFLGETMQSLAEELAAPLRDRLILDTAVSKIVRGEAGISLETSAGRFEAERVIVAVPPVMASRIAFEPPLPDRLRNALRVWRSGTVAKIKLRYGQAFWRDKGLSGMVMWRDIHGLFVCDTSRDDDHPALVVFVSAQLAVDWGSRENWFEAEVKPRLVAAFGPEAADFVAITTRDWTDDRWSGGGYNDLVMDLAAHDAEDVLRAGAGTIQFASSELSPSFPGYVEGAIIAGRIAAGKIIG